MSQDNTGTPEATGPDAVTPDASTTPAVGTGGTVPAGPSASTAAPVGLDKPAPAADPVPPAPVEPAPVASLDDDVALAPVAVAAVPVGPGLGSRLAAEAFGTLFLVIAGLGTALYANVTGLGGGPLAVSLAFGLAGTSTRQSRSARRSPGARRGRTSCPTGSPSSSAASPRPRSCT
jgi:aquaporin Z